MIIELPSMVAGRALADALVDRLDGDLAGAVVVLDCRHLVTGSPSFAARVVARVLGGGAAELRVDAAPAAFVADLRDAAGRLGAADRLVVRQAAAA
ncbi:hypothetical protein [Pseudokineococcus lusitanus]|uniref:STAS domain-containing protein n=1 Tax=Pseudokineococcus lusitanus TaxID=763993 RepID=A0A3N1G8I1_9ACTN|nr:hypothetical protein [Pseudokineococcus lusitanus]ROP26514.1 hypothetical protein EDC03_3437 [Pseudokineococcus lusitanus]